MLSIESLNLLGESWAAFMAVRLIESTLVFILIGIIWMILKKRLSAAMGCWLFILVFLKLIIPGPLILHKGATEWLPLNYQGKIYSQPMILEMRGKSESVSAAANENTSTIPALTESAKIKSPSASLTANLLILWSALVGFLAVRFLFIQRRTRRFIQRSKTINPEKLPIHLHKVLKTAGAKKHIRIVLSKEAPSPVVWGLFRPVLVVPFYMITKYSSSQIEWIFLHEMAHIRRYDNLIYLFQKLIQILFFFHPIVWITGRIVDQLREYSCDDSALADCMSPRKDCGKAFLNMVLQSNITPTFIQGSVSGVCASKTYIRKRLLRILYGKQILKRSLPLGSTVFLAGLALVVCLFSFGGNNSALNGHKNRADSSLSRNNTITIPLPNLASGAKKLEMVLIKAGSFKMGSPRKESSRRNTDWPTHEVTISNDFYMGKFEVTQAQWEAVLGEHKFYFRGKPDNPAEKVSWRACQRFIRRLNSLGLGVFRLPTEAEWEYACRAGTETRFFFGDTLDLADQYMWWEGNNDPYGTKEVALKKPNPWGLYDMHGNVSEWCSDKWKAPYTRGHQTDPQESEKVPFLIPFLWTNRVFRGGGFSYKAHECRSAVRSYEQSIDYHYTVGFRLVREVLNK